jgi:ubiquitin C-terminal hydrolase
MDIQRFKMDLSWYEKTGHEYSPLVPMFNGQSISQIICGHCQKIFHNYEIYLNLMIPITQNTKTIYDCLDEYFKEEYINTDCPIWKCDSCQNKHISKKTTKLWRLPDILVISLKRFTFDLKKNNTPINIPEILDISKYCLTAPKNKYRLQSIAHHYGSNDSGHYAAVCKNNEKWYECDDLNIKSIEKPNNEFGYVFFYTLDSS